MIDDLLQKMNLQFHNVASSIPNIIKYKSAFVLSNYAYIFYKQNLIQR